jgi:hypothetical protein
MCVLFCLHALPQVLLAPIVDPNWDNGTVDRDSASPRHGWRGASASVSLGDSLSILESFPVCISLV